MMTIQLHNLTKRYNKQFIFAGVTYTFTSGQHYAITGTNGSGKSTLLLSIAGAVQATSGTITYTHNSSIINSDNVYKHLSLAAPYIELIQEYTLYELLQFHQNFKPLYPGHTISTIANSVGLTSALHKPLINYSSGMHQRVKLALAFFSTSNMLLLDEPTANLDAEGTALYHSLLAQYHYNRTVIISSNIPAEYATCNHVIDIATYKSKS